MEEPCRNCKQKIENMSIVKTFMPIYCIVCKNRDEEEIKKLITSTKSL